MTQRLSNKHSPTERIQKVLARAGVGSRRQVEQWIEAGRLAVNGVSAAPGTKIGPRDKVTLDGRPVRLRESDAGPSVVVYHRPARVNLASAEDPAAAKFFEKLPKRAGRRWLTVSPLPPNDSGLELLTTDGTLAQALMRKLAELPVEFAIRVLGDPRLQQLAHLKAGTLEDGEALKVESVELVGGEGANRWFKLTVRGGRARDIHRLCAAADLRLSRLMRVGLGPLKMDRSVSSARIQPLSLPETEALYALAGLSAARVSTSTRSAGNRKSGPSRRGSRAPAKKRKGGRSR